MTSALLWITAVAVVVGCVTCECDEGQKSVKVVTYNTGLAPTVPGYATRRDNVINALNETDFNVGCFQEVWFEIDVKEILDTLVGTKPHHFSAIHEAPDILRGSAPDLAPCTYDEVVEIVYCSRSYCYANTSAEDKNKCIVENCPDKIYGVNQKCRTCISVAGSKDEVVTKCLNGTNRFNTPGLLVVSEQPLSDVKFVDYHDDRKMLIQRGYIQAQVGSVTFVCTHLSSVLPYFYDVNMTDLYKDYKEMQRAESVKVAEAVSSIKDHVLMGDLNTGPARSASGQPIIKGEAKENYDELICKFQYYNPYMKDMGLCTYCNSDNGATWENHKEDAIVDHVLLSKHFHPVSTVSERIFTQTKGQLSDHYGVTLSMCLS